MNSITSVELSQAFCSQPNDYFCQDQVLQQAGCPLYLEFGQSCDRVCAPGFFPAGEEVACPCEACPKLVQGQFTCSKVHISYDPQPLPMYTAEMPSITLLNTKDWSKGIANITVGGMPVVKWHLNSTSPDYYLGGGDQVVFQPPPGLDLWANTYQDLVLVLDPSEGHVGRGTMEVGCSMGTFESGGPRTCKGTCSYCHHVIHNVNAYI